MMDRPLFFWLSDDGFSTVLSQSTIVDKSEGLPLHKSMTGWELCPRPRQSPSLDIAIHPWKAESYGIDFWVQPFKVKTEFAASKEQLKIYYTGFLKDFAEP